MQLLKVSQSSPFLDALLERHEAWRALPILSREGDDWRGFALAIPPPAGSRIAFPLDIEEVGGQVSIALDYCHVHVPWPAQPASTVGRLWTDALTTIDAILNEEIVALSGWIDGKVRVGSMHEADKPFRLPLSNLQHLRVRSWRGTLDRDEELLPRN